MDCNNFYASCEKLFNPSIKNRPVVVLSNNDGCVIARSAEVKKLGIPMGAPAFKLKDDIKGLIDRFRQNMENQHLLRELEEKIRILESR